ncbi:hypothetical protein AAGT95_18110 [Salinicola lusitanus]|uniref:Uncharacterized protein n=1 Tax=Salinicola lusitanus TaxID=1949085 RepID=A0ABZ3CRG9_9GAMM
MAFSLATVYFQRTFIDLPISRLPPYNNGNYKNFQQPEISEKGIKSRRQPVMKNAQPPPVNISIFIDPYFKEYVKKPDRKPITN